MSDAWEEAIERLSDLQPFIEYLVQTDESEWAVDVVRTKDGKNCLFGHLVDWYYGKGYEGSISTAWDAFEAMWMNTYVIYPINDGQNPRYQQPTPKQRVVAYMKNLWLGLEEDINTGWERDAAEAKSRGLMSLG